MSARDGLSDSQRLAGDLCQWLFDEFCAEWDFRLGGGQFRIAYAEEIGCEDDDPTLLVIRRESDGKLFEVELEAFVTEFSPRPGPRESSEPASGPGQLPFDAAVAP